MTHVALAMSPGLAAGAVAGAGAVLALTRALVRLAAPRDDRRRDQ
ncbi:MAG: hypothetical protein QOF76_3636 [Solirubrobacteraceae bacterium]|jgi:hypothetical protein|nr:hypothetical protein [Solirubrobacteraceae bacterium]